MIIYVCIYIVYVNLNAAVALSCNFSVALSWRGESEPALRLAFVDLAGSERLPAEARHAMTWTAL